MPGANDDLFADLTAARSRRGRPEWIASLLAHAGIAAALVLLPLFASDHPPELVAGGLRVFLAYDPPPPPPPPIARGPGLAPSVAPQTPPTTIPSRAPELLAPSTATAASETLPIEPSEPAGGDPSGSAWGEPGGMPGGVAGGVIGGIPGGVLGGVIGGTGRGAAPVPVQSPDHPARLLRMIPPHYPRDAFVAKREGTVILEILIDDLGRVVSVRVLRSVPLLDDAAIQTVYAWQFAPAIHGGRPVASLAQAPITFRIY